MKQRWVMPVMVATSLAALAFIAGSFAQEEPSQGAWKDLEAQYARANLELAQARLAIAEQENRELANSVTGETLASLRGGVALAEGQLNSVQENGAQPYAGYITEAQARVQGAQQKLRKSQEANAIEAGAVSQEIIGREKAELAVAAARLAMLKVLAEQPSEVQLRWEIRQLQDEIRALWFRPLIRE